jgi:hypothetical protein
MLGALFLCAADDFVEILLDGGVDVADDAPEACLRLSYME